jgi:hypothetical protein
MASHHLGWGARPVTSEHRAPRSCSDTLVVHVDNMLYKDPLVGAVAGPDLPVVAIDKEWGNLEGVQELADEGMR